MKLKEVIFFAGLCVATFGQKLVAQDVFDILSKNRIECIKGGKHMDSLRKFFGNGGEAGWYSQHIYFKCGDEKITLSLTGASCDPCIQVHGNTMELLGVPYNDENKELILEELINILSNQRGFKVGDDIIICHI